MKSLITLILLFIVTSAHAQLQLPAKSEHTGTGECEEYVHDTNPALVEFFNTYVSERYEYVGALLTHQDYADLLNNLVEFSEVGSWKTYVRETHRGRTFYITQLNDEQGNLYDILIFSGDINNPDKYISFESPYQKCEYIGNGKLHQISNTFTSVINYKRKREVIGVVDESRHLEFVMDDGSSIIYEFCHKDKNGEGYYHWGNIDTSNGEGTWKFHTLSRDEDIKCEHNHRCLVLNINSEICNH